MAVATAAAGRGRSGSSGASRPAGHAVTGIGTCPGTSAAAATPSRAPILVRRPEVRCGAVAAPSTAGHRCRHRVGGASAAAGDGGQERTRGRGAARPPTATTTERLHGDADGDRRRRGGAAGRPRSGRRRRRRLESMAGVPTASVFGAELAHRRPAGARGRRRGRAPRWRCAPACGRCVRPIEGDAVAVDRRRACRAAASPRRGGRTRWRRPGPRRSPPRRGARPCRRWPARRGPATPRPRCGARRGRTARAGGRWRPPRTRPGRRPASGAEPPHAAGHARHDHEHADPRRAPPAGARSVPAVALRHGRAGPIAMRKSSARPMGRVMASK